MGGYPLPESGAAGMSPRQVRERLAANGWHPLPIIAGQKRPSVRDWSRFATRGASPATVHELAAWERGHSGAPGTGVACGNVVAIDVDVEHRPTVDAIERIAFEVFGETPFIRVGRAPRETLIYRAAESIAKQSFAGLDILGAGSQFVAFAIHPDTSALYEWIGDETPLTARPGEAPEITTAHVKEFLSRVSRVIELAKPGSRAARHGAGGGMSAITVNEAGKVVDGRDAFLSNCIYRAIVTLDEAGEITPRSANYRGRDAFEKVTALGWETFCNGAVLDVGGKIIDRAEAEEKARGKLNAYAQVRLPFQQEAAPKAARPSHDVSERVTLADADAAQEARVNAFAEAVRNGVAERNRITARSPRIPGLQIPFLPAGRVVASETGLGKSRAAIRAITTLARTANIAMAAPTVALAQELASRFDPKLVDARVWLGREQDDPDTPGEKVCRRPEAARLAGKVRGPKSVAELICGKGESTCPLARVCYYQKQRRGAKHGADGGRPVVWIFTHAMLFLPKPAWLGRLDGLVIDESFASSATGDRRTFDADRLHTLARRLDSDSRAWFEALARAIEANGVGFMRRESMVSAGVAADMSNAIVEAARAEIESAKTNPAGADADLVKTLAAVGERNRDAAELSDMASEFADFLTYRNGAAAGRIRVESRDGAPVLVHAPFKTIDGSWGAETLMLDAEPPPLDFLRAAFPTVAIAPFERIRARLPAAVHVTQIIGAPAASHKLGLGWARAEGKTPAEIAPRVYDAIARFVRGEAAKAGQVGFIGQKDARECLEGMDLPENVAAMHYGKIAGFDGLKDVDTLIVWGQAAPGPQEAESIVGAYTGVAPVSLAGAYYGRVTGGIALARGGGVATPHYRHPDPRCEEVRYWLCEGQISQALGRARYLRRDEKRPLGIILVSNVPTALPVNEVKAWKEAHPRASASPIVFQSEADAMKAFGLTRQRARDHVAGFEAAKSGAWRTVAYKVGEREGEMVIAARTPGQPALAKGDIKRAVAAIGGEADIGLARAVRLLFPSPLARIVQEIERAPAGRVYRALREAGGELSERELRRKLAAMDAGEFAAACEELVAEGGIEVVRVGGGKRGLRPRVLRLLVG